MLLRGHAQFIVKGVVEDLLEVVPVRDVSAADGVCLCKDAPLTLRFIADIGGWEKEGDIEKKLRWENVKKERKRGRERGEKEGERRKGRERN